MKSLRLGLCWCQLLLILLWGAQAAAQDAVCAVVKIEIRQELTLERQGFDAHMRINNGLDGLSLENVGIDVGFTDENGHYVRGSSNPDDTAASFFIRIDSLAGIDNVSGSGRVAPASSADIHWLIVPAPGSGGQIATGKLYYVGATLRYTLGGEAQVTEVSPDYIFVKPLPLMSLDYFLTREIYADDAFTDAIEPAEPFTLGVRVRNNGQGLAKNIRIESAQPEIVENEQGLLIDFVITGSTINDQPATPSLLVDLGSIAPGASTVGRWIMETTLSGKFIAFDAEFSHAAELGGTLTSLIDAVTTHSLLRDVLIDLPGRDGIHDFLALDGDTLRVYESSGVDTPVTDQSAQSTLTAAGQSGDQLLYELTTPVTAGFMFVKLPDPHQGNKSVAAAVRSDGKPILADNVWFSKERENRTEWHYYFNLLDVNSTGQYTLAVEDNVNRPQPPVLQFIPDRQVGEGQQVAFLVEASDPNGTVPAVGVSPLPPGASFSLQSSSSVLSTWVFDWTPVAGQAGEYALLFTASDGLLASSRTATITVCSLADSDCDGMDDDWERDHFGNLDRDGSGDFDGDGISDLDEFLQGTDPKAPDGPSVPVIVSPEDQAEVTMTQPLLQVENSSHRPDAEPVYHFEVYDDPGLASLVTDAEVAEGTDVTEWTVDQSLADNHWFWWRVKACDETLCSEWASARMFVNTVNDPPEPFHLSSPADGIDVGVATPTLSVTNSVDRDGDVITYGFEVFADGGLSTLVTSVDGLQQGVSGTTEWTVDIPLTEDTLYYWRATATDEHGAKTVSAELRSLFVDTLNSPPGLPTIISPAAGDEVALLSLNLVAGNALDPDDELLNYWFELDTVATFDSPDHIASAAIPGGNGTTRWAVDGLTDNTRYYWRVKACDGVSQSDWVVAGFFVNLSNEPPTTPAIANPGDGAWVETLRPTLSLGVSTDPDSDLINYRFEVYAGGGQGARLAEHLTDVTEWVLDFDLDDNSWFGWRALASDDQGAESPWSEMHRFFVNDNGIDDPPTITVSVPDADITPTGTDVTIGWEDTDPDSNAGITLYYSTDPTGTGGILIADGLQEDPDGEADQYHWDISALLPGNYTVFARIADATTNDVESFAPGRVIIPPVAPQGGISVAHTTHAVTTEAGVSARFELVLDSAPEADVSVPLVSSDPGEATVDPESVTFTPANWATPQTVTVTGINDCLLDGDVGYVVATGPAQSTDPAYTGVDADDLAFTNLDNDTSATGEGTLYVCNYVEVSRRRVGRTTYDFTYRVELTNASQVATPVGVMAIVSSSSPYTQVIDGDVLFGAVAGGETQLSDDTFTIRHNARYPYDPSMLSWDLQIVP